MYVQVFLYMSQVFPHLSLVTMGYVSLSRLQLTFERTCLNLMQVLLNKSSQIIINLFGFCGLLMEL